MSKQIKLSPAIKSLLGSVKLFDNMKERKILADEMTKKHLGKK